MPRRRGAYFVKNRIAWERSWPGLASLWIAGDVRGLFLALVFASALNLALIETFIWPDLFGETSPAGVWGIVGAIWLIGFFLRVRRDSQGNAGGQNDECQGDALFIQAQTEYLSGHWDEAAWLLERLVAREPRDVEARLLLATLYRHQRRFERAETQRRMLERLDASLPWAREIAREAELAEQFQRFEGTDQPETADEQPIADAEVPAAERRAA